MHEHVNACIKKLMPQQLYPKPIKLGFFQKNPGLNQNKSITDKT